ncbi:MAG: HAD family phosphatase [Pseudomonadota bacterium]
MKAVFFDFDGVICDSMPGHVNSWLHASREQGVVINAELIYKNEGVTTLEAAELIRNIAAKNNIKVDVPKLIRSKTEYYEKFCRPGIFKDVPGMLEKIKKLGFKIGIVSGGDKEVIKKDLPKELLKYFDVIVDASDYKKGKPAPDAYLTAAKKLKLPPADCVALENAPLGIKAAKSAGMKCIAITTTLKKEDLSEADVIINGHSEVPGILS